MSQVLPTLHCNDIQANDPDAETPRGIVDEELIATLALVAKEMGGSELECRVILWPAASPYFTPIFQEEFADGNLWIQAAASTERFR
jgi:hypothetical protein